jgi:hypothetical protein
MYDDAVVHVNFGIPWLPCVVAPTSPKRCSLAQYQKMQQTIQQTRDCLLFIAAFVVEHTKFSPDTHTHTHTLSLKYCSTLVACFCTNYIFLETLKFSKTPFLKEPIFL